MPLVTPTGDHATFSVTSADDADPYFVDLTANDGFMACTCRDWQCRVAPRIREGKPLKPFGSVGRGLCKHINAILIYLGRQVWCKMFGDYEPLGRIQMDKIYILFGQSVVAQINGKQRTDIFEDKL